MQVIGVKVVAQGVLVGKKWLTSILSASQAELNPVVIVELVAQVMTVAIAQIGRTVALALVHGSLQGCLQRVVAIPGQRRPGGEAVMGGGCDRVAAHEAGQEAACVTVEAGNQQQLVQGAHGLKTV